MNIDFDDLELPLALLASAGAPAPRRAVRDQLMARIRAEQPAAPPGFTFHLATDRNTWRPHPVPGIQMKVLSLDRDRGCATSSPAASSPADGDWRPVTSSTPTPTPTTASSGPTPDARCCWSSHRKITCRDRSKADLKVGLYQIRL